MVYFLLLINLYARFTRYEPWFLSDINHISWIVFILAKFNFTKWLSISPRFQAFHQDDFNFTKSFSISPRVFRFHQESCALGEQNFVKILTNVDPIYVTQFMPHDIMFCQFRIFVLGGFQDLTSCLTSILKLKPIEVIIWLMITIKNW